VVIRPGPERQGISWTKEGANYLLQLSILRYSLGCLGGILGTIKFCRGSLSPGCVTQPRADGDLMGVGAWVPLWPMAIVHENSPIAG
jgi:hypothetical protein